MFRRLHLGLVVIVICVVSAAGQADVVTIPDVPSYLWYKGCGPTAAGMIIGYWDAHGYENLIQGSNDCATNDYGVKLMIASPGHIAQYWPTPDCNSFPHSDNCVADFNWCSRDWTTPPTEQGWSSFGMQPDGLAGYAAYRGYTGFSAWNETYFNDSFWTAYVGEIKAGRPVELLIDTDDNDAQPDHFVTGIGYDNSTSTLKYACYNTWDQNVHWYEFHTLSSSNPYGIYGGTFFGPVPEPASATLLAAGALWLLALRRRRRRR